MIRGAFALVGLLVCQSTLFAAETTPPTALDDVVIDFSGFSEALGSGLVGLVGSLLGLSMGLILISVSVRWLWSIAKK